MALSVALPPMAALPPDPTVSRRTEPCGAFPTISCGFEPCLGRVKRESQSPEHTMHPPSFPVASFPSLSSAHFSDIKQGHTDLYADTDETEAFSSWAYKHPQHWESKEVLDWVFSLTEDDQFDGALLRGEAYNTLTGRQMCNMSVEEFMALDHNYGARVHQIFNWLVEDANFKKPLPPDTFRTECFHGNVSHLDFLHLPDHMTPPRHTPPPSHTPPSMSVYLDRQGQELKVSLDGLGLYDIDVDFSSLSSHRHDFTAISNNSKQEFSTAIEDSDYHSGSEGGPEGRRVSVSSDAFEAMVSEDEDGDRGDGGGSRVRKTYTPSSSSTSTDSGCEGDERKPSSRKRQPSASASKGNHLWEFIRDLLKNPMFNPTLVKWEDRDSGVFRFVQSEAVAQLWGRKKNNPQMTYEKLSRAMRFCRSAGYFASVPKTGRFPKKLCFKFGLKAHGWQD